MTDTLTIPRLDDLLAWRDLGDGTFRDDRPGHYHWHCAVDTVLWDWRPDWTTPSPAGPEVARLLLAAVVLWLWAAEHDNVEVCDLGGAPEAWQMHRGLAADGDMRAGLDARLRAAGVDRSHPDSQPVAAAWATLYTDTGLWA